MDKDMELKECPFCGGEAEFDRIGTSRQSEIVKCTDCHCTLESSDQDHYSGSSWNTRPQPTEQIDHRVCFKCGSSNTNTFRHFNAKIWCEDCGYVNRDEGSTQLNILQKSSPESKGVEALEVVNKLFKSLQFKKKGNHHAKVYAEDVIIELTKIKKHVGGVVMEFKEPRIVHEESLKHKIFEALMSSRMSTQELTVICNTSYGTVRKTLSRLTENKCVEPVTLRGKAYVYKLTDLFKHLNGMKI
jgi:ribosomal protein L37AE/L43A